MANNFLPGGGISESLDAAGQVNLDQMVPILNSFQSDAIDYLYDLEPQSQNLFYAGFFYEAKDGNKQEKAFYNAAYRIRSISIPMPKMEIDQNNVLRAPIFKNASFSQEVTIEWMEDVYHSVQKYHLDWYARWYNRQFDVLRCGVGGKFRQLTVVAYHYINTDANSIIETPRVQPIMIFTIGGLIPLDIPDMKFDYSSDQNDSPVSMRYKCGRIQWIYSDELGLGKSANIWGDGSTASSELKKTISWNPTNFAEDPKNEGAKDFELLRTTRAATSYQASEGALG